MWTLVLALLVSLTLATAGAPSPQAGTFIRVVQDQGIWWFQDGDGRRFFSLGVNCVGGCFGHAEDAPLTPSRQAWMLSLLQAWGFNTVGAWSSPSVWDALDFTDQIYAPFAPTADDVFDEAFWGGRMADRVTQEVQPFLGRKRFIGYFLDNEPGWPAPEIFDFYVSLAKDKPGSQALITYLKAYYHGRIDQLNRDWGTVYAGFEQLPGARPPQPYPPSMRQGLVQAWRIEVASTFYRRYAAMVRALDPDHLLLGIRYQGVPDEALFTALSPYFDVNSINDYTRYGQLNPQLADLYQATGLRSYLIEAERIKRHRRRSWSACIGSCGGTMGRRIRPWVVIGRIKTSDSCPTTRPRCTRNSGRGSRGPTRRSRRSTGPPAGTSPRCGHPCVSRCRPSSPRSTGT